jgi:hypothetical protein
MSEDEHENALDEAIHHLAQPLTALTFVIGLGRLQENPDAWKNALDTAAAECQRAVEALNVVRYAAATMCAECKEDA